MKAAEITDQNGLEAWLKEQPKEVRVWIAARAAARVLPIYWKSVAQNTTAQNGDLTALSACRALLTPFSFANANNAAAKEAVAAAARSARAIYRSTYDAAYTSAAVSPSRAAYSAARAIYSVIRAATFDNDSDFESSKYDTSAFEAATASATGFASYGLDANYPLAFDFANVTIFADARCVEAHRVNADPQLWPEGMPDKIAAAWQATLDALPEVAGDQPDYRSFWVPWYQGLLDGKSAFPRALTEAVALIPEDDWKQGDLHINNTVIPRLMAAHGHDTDADGSGVEEGAPERRNTSSRIRSVRAQVATLQDFLDAEVEALRGHNERSPVEDDILEVLKDLKALVEQMIERLDDAGSDARVVTVVNEDLPVIVEKTGELAVIEPEPQVSPTVMTMAATIRVLTDAGADPKLATQIAMGEAANQRIWPRILRLFGKGKT